MPTLGPLPALDQLNPARFDAPAILKRLASSSRARNAGFRKLPGTALKDCGGQTAYTPP